MPCDPVREERRTRLPDRQAVDVAAAVPETGCSPGGVMPGILALLLRYLHHRFSIVVVFQVDAASLSSYSLFLHVVVSSCRYIVVSLCQTS